MVLFKLWGGIFTCGEKKALLPESWGILIQGGRRSSDRHGGVVEMMQERASKIKKMLKKITIALMERSKQMSGYWIKQSGHLWNFLESTFTKPYRLKMGTC